MPADPSVDLAALDALFAAATPGAWWTGDRSEIDDAGCVMASAWDRMASDATVAGCNDHDPRRIANAALIAALHNAWPSLKRRLEIGDAAVEVIDAEAELARRQGCYALRLADYAYVEEVRGLPDAARARLRALREAQNG